MRQQLRKIDWLARFYRKYFTDLPLKRTEESIRRQQQVELEALSNQQSNNIEPLFVIFLDTDNAGIIEVGVCMNWISSQSYPDWLLVLNGDDYCLVNIDARILSKADFKKLIKTNRNLKCSSANHIFVTQISVDVRLHEYALHTIAQNINAETKVIYSDHDFIGSNGKRHSSCFKPEWNLDLFLSQDYLSSLTFISANEFNSQKGGWFKSWQVYSSQYQRIVCLLDNLNSTNVVHVPYLLCHLSEPQDATHIVEDRKALASYLHKYGASAEQGLLPTSHKVNWAIPEDKPLVSIIIPTRNGKALVKQCIDSIYQLTTYQNFEILLVDNQSDDASAITYFSELAQSNQIRLLHYDAEFNYSAINNFAAKKANGSILVLLNNDVEVISPNWLSEIVANVSRKDIGCVGAMLYYPNNTIQHAGVILGLGRCAGHSHKHYPRGSDGYMNRLKLVQNYSAVTAACLGVRKSVYFEVNGLNETDLTVAFNDVDFCIKVEKAGYRNLWSPYIELYHHESISRGAENTPAKRKRAKAEIEYMQNTWQLDSIHDPAYHPMLTIEREDFTV